MAQSWLLGACVVMAITLAIVLSVQPSTKDATEHALMSAVGAVYRAFAPAPPERSSVEAVIANLSRYHGRRIQLRGIARSVDSADGMARFQLEDRNDDHACGVRRSLVRQVRRGIDDRRRGHRQRRRTAQPQHLLPAR